MKNTVFATLLLLVSQIAATCLGDIHLARRGESNFGYEWENGPLKWADLSAENALCRDGHQQSPINIGTKFITSNTGTIGGQFENLGTTLQLAPTGGNRTIRVQDVDYKLAQFHLHSPSEHHLNGQHYPLEVHFVHKSAEGKVLVLGVFFDLAAISREGDKTIRTLANLVDNISTRGEAVKVSPDQLRFEHFTNSINLENLVTYNGSLTTPPCSEGIKWVLSTEVKHVDATSLNALRKTLKFNSRGIQQTPQSS